MTRTTTNLSLIAGLLLFSAGGCCCKATCGTNGNGGTGGGTCNIALVNDTATACPGTGSKVAANIPVTANDTLGSGALTITVATQGTLGAAVVNPDNTISYAATDPASTGQDTFTYQVCTGTGTSCCRTATVTVLLDTNTPTAESFTTDSVATSASTTIDLAANVTPATAGLTYAIDTSATLGTASVDPATGLVSYTAPATLPNPNTPAVITGVTIGGSSSEAANRAAVLTIDGSLLAGFTTIDTGTHGNVADNTMWNTNDDDPTWTQNGGPGYLGFITFDLGAVYDVSKFHVWNWNNDLFGLLTRGIKNVSIKVSETDTLLGTAQPSGAGITALSSPTQFARGNGGTEPGQVFDVSFRARYVRFDILSTQGDATTDIHAGLSEVRFHGAAATDAADGTDTFTYTVTDSCGNTSAAGTVTIPITANAARLAAVAPAKVLVVNESSAEITVYVGGTEVDVVQPRGTTIVPRDVVAGDNQQIRVEALSASPQSNKSTSTEANLEPDGVYTITYTDTGDGNPTIQVEEQ